MPPSLLESQLATLEPLTPDEPGFGVETTGSPTDVAADVLTRTTDGNSSSDAPSGAGRTDNR
jgi:gluconokinase